MESRASAAMRRAIEISRDAAEHGNRPFGAVLVDKSGNIILEAENCVSSLGGDVTAHAETQLVRKMAAAEIPAADRAACTLFTSTEPCVMCAGAIFWSGVGKIVYGCSAAAMAEFAGPGGWDLPAKELFVSAPRKIVVEGPLLEAEALDVHRQYWGSVSGPRRSDVFAPKALPTPARIGPYSLETDHEVDSLAEVAIEKNLLTSGLGAAKATEGEAPIIDLLQPDCADAIWNAASQVGFFTVINHGIPESDIKAAFDASRTFFDLPRDVKETQAPFAKNANSGYEFMAQIRPSTGTPDQKESLQITARTGCMDGRWPRDPVGFEHMAKTFAEKSHALAARILTMLEKRACPKLPPGKLAAAHKLWAEDGQCTLRMLHYPPVDEPEKMPANYWRAGAHTDWCCITLLFQLPGNAGLECAANPRARGSGNGGWLKVDPVAGGIAINIGDMLSRWSDGRLLSNLHRVRMPSPDECVPPRSRYSIAFFMQADKEQLIECDEHEPISAGDYILGRIRSNYAKVVENA